LTALLVIMQLYSCKMPTLQVCRAEQSMGQGSRVMGQMGRQIWMGHVRHASVP